MYDKTKKPKPMAAKPDVARGKKRGVRKPKR